jgi:hypothetical protein
MKKAMLLTVGVSCLLAGMAVPATAQLGWAALKSDVPFAFVSGNRTLQAGQYFIEIGQARVRFLDASRHQVQGIFSNTQACNLKAEQPRLVFHRYGETYFLSQIWSSAYKIDLPTSRTEYQLRASMKADQGTVTLAMR